jgi:hypothetical protein
MDMNINGPILRRLNHHMVTGTQKKVYSEEYNLNSVIKQHLFCNLFYCQ